MDKDELLEDFFRTLKIAVTNAFTYSKDHPYFVKSVDNLKIKLDQLLEVLNPLSIGITNNTIIADGRSWSKLGFYDELARMLHQRRIKIIRIIPGSSAKELIALLSVITLPQKDIFQSGGPRSMLEQKGLKHISIEDLDYSSFLGSQGQSCNDLWPYLFREALTEEDALKVSELAGNFANMLKKITEKELFGSQDLCASITDFLIYLKNKDRGKFIRCAKDLFLWLARNKHLLDEQKISMVKAAFEGLDKEEFVDLLWEGLASEAEFDALSLSLFAKISYGHRHEDIAQGLSRRIQDSRGLSSNPKIAKKLHKLLSIPPDGSIPVAYLNSLGALLKEMPFEGGLVFDQAKLKENFRYIILSLLVSEEDKNKLIQLSLELDKALDAAFKEKDLAYIGDAYRLLLDKNRGYPGVFLVQRSRIESFVEDAVWEALPGRELERLSDKLAKPLHDLNFFLTKIFTQGKVNPCAMSLFLRLFADNMPEFYASLGRKQSDIEFLARMVQALKGIDSAAATEALKHIYKSANQLIKIEALRAMGQRDPEFILSILRNGPAALRKEAAFLQLVNARERSKGLEVLLNIPGRWGSKNRLILENMQIVQDLGLREAGDYIRGLRRRRFFWNRKIRKKAQEILKEWDVY